ncbi:cell wall hydrolase [Metabacillus sediminilitoris]|uniref:Cell wall hydrolase n=2 Tax=Metabacillus sediminilitoris TaxID=2567941 RepID=A0A4S4C3F7_9BACI|nr:cell wall hydrolase [Metabacillus sediminilitoris]QGQ45419.1 cell wall hydrolase [Metabacillus sediminilitoris]THF82283.1 cell wall hydrolase [Metabacillus sediminilitoris]
MLKVMSFVFFLCFMFFIPNSTFAQEILHNGSQGQEVYELQEKLEKMGYFNSQPTGYYGSITDDAVKKLQLDSGLLPDGVFGFQTQAKLNNIDMMARVVHGEARGETYEGKVAVAAVILNRMSTPGFPKNIYQVIFQTNAFTAVHDGQYDLTPNSYAYQAVIDALKGWDPTYGSVYYYNPLLATDEWIFTRDTVIRIGNHLFAK